MGRWLYEGDVVGRWSMIRSKTILILICATMLISAVSIAGEGVWGTDDGSQCLWGTSVCPIGGGNGGSGTPPASSEYMDWGDNWGEKWN